MDNLADLSNDVDAVFISKNDRLYRPPYAREPNTTAYNNYVPYFICSVSNLTILWEDRFPLQTLVQQPRMCCITVTTCSTERM